MSEKIKMLDKVRILKGGFGSLCGCIGRINSIEGGEYLAQLGDGSGGWYSPDHLEIMDESVPVDASPSARSTYADVLAIARQQQAKTHIAQSTTIIDLQEHVRELRNILAVVAEHGLYTEDPSTAYTQRRIECVDAINQDAGFIEKKICAILAKYPGPQKEIHDDK